MSKRNLSFGWIEASLRYGGVFGSAEKIVYREIFGLSEPTVSRRQAEFELLFEEACGKVLLRDSEGRVQGGKLVLKDDAELPEEPVFTPMPSLERWLEETLGGSSYSEEDLRRRDPDHRIIRAVIRAIRSETPLLLTVPSREREQSHLVSPHAIFRIKGRLLMRAHVHLTGQYRNFLLTRITRAVLAPGADRYMGPRLDASWARFRTVVTNDRGIPPVQEPEAFGFGDDDYEWRSEVEVREALLPFFRDEIVQGYPDPAGDGDPKPGRS